MTESQHTPNTNITNRECSIQDAISRIECSIQDIIIEHLIQVSLMIACCMKLKVATYSIEKLY